MKTVPGFRYAVLGCGPFGLAAAHDLLVHGAARELLLVDPDRSAAEKAAKRLKSLAPSQSRAARLESRAAGAADLGALRLLFKKKSSALSFLPGAAAEAALKEKVPFCDATEGEEPGRILKLDAQARKAGTKLVPGCGLGAGFAAMLAAAAMESLDFCAEVRLYAGCLGGERELPLSCPEAPGLGPLLSAYRGEAAVLRQGRMTNLPALSEREEVEFAEPVGTLEAFLTRGGPPAFAAGHRDRLRTFEFKSLRRSGHLAQFLALRELGFLGEEPVRLNGISVAPRSLADALVRARLAGPAEGAVVAVRAACRGQKNGRPAESCCETVELEDSPAGFSALQRVVGATAGTAAWLLASGAAKKNGALPPELAFPASEFLRQARKRGLRVRETIRSGVPGNG